MERTRLVTIATPVNKPREAQSLRELPVLRPSGGAQSFWPWYYVYNYILLHTIIYRALGVANGNNHFLLHAAVHPGLHCTEFDGWTLIGCLRYTCHSVATLLNADWLSSREIEIHFNSSEFVAPQIRVNVLACARRKCGATNQTCRRFSLAKNSPDTRL